LTVFSCYRAAHNGPIPQQIMNSALVIEFFHNVSLIIDDIVDKSPMRRGRPTLHRRFGELSALMTAGYIVADGYARLARDLQAIELFSELLQRLGVAECMQWRLRRTPLGVEDWRKIAAEDTGSMFEVCACLGDRSGRLRRFGGLLGLLYHGCDDAGDIRGANALGSGGEEDVPDGILTLPAGLAIRHPLISKTFCNPDPTRWISPPSLGPLLPNCRKPSMSRPDCRRGTQRSAPVLDGSGATRRPVGPNATAQRTLARLYSGFGADYPCAGNNCAGDEPGDDGEPIARRRQCAGAGPIERR